jgi:hypothetical protein
MKYVKMEYWKKHSNIPSFHYSIFPLFQFSNFPFSSVSYKPVNLHDIFQYPVEIYFEVD